MKQNIPIPVVIVVVLIIVAVVFGIFAMTAKKAEAPAPGAPGASVTGGSKLAPPSGVAGGVMDKSKFTPLERSRMAVPGNIPTGPPNNPRPGTMPVPGAQPRTGQ